MSKHLTSRESVVEATDKLVKHNGYESKIRVVMIQRVDESYKIGVWGNFDYGFKKEGMSKEDAYKIFQSIPEVITFGWISSCGFEKVIAYISPHDTLHRR